MIRVAVIGAGTMGRRHVALLNRSRRATVAAVVDPDPAALRRARDDFGATLPAYETIDAMLRLEQPGVDAVVVACPTRGHVSAAERLLDAGYHVLVEKPLAATVEGAWRLQDAAGREGAPILMVGHVERFNPAAVKLRRLLADASVGRVYRATSTRIGPPPGRDLGVGVAQDLLSHDVDALAYVLGQPFLDVHARGSDRDVVAIAEFGGGLVRDGDGVTALLEASWLSPEKRREIAVYCDAGLYRVDLIRQEVWYAERTTDADPWPELALLIGANDGVAHRYHLLRDEPLRVEQEAFLDTIEGAPNPCPVEDGVAAVEAVEAIMESLADPGAGRRGRRGRGMAVA